MTLTRHQQAQARMKAARARKKLAAARAAEAAKEDTMNEMKNQAEHPTGAESQATDAAVEARDEASRLDPEDKDQENEDQEHEAAPLSLIEEVPIDEDPLDSITNVVSSEPLVKGDETPKTMIAGSAETINQETDPRNVSLETTETQENHSQMTTNEHKQKSGRVGSSGAVEHGGDILNESLETVDTQENYDRRASKERKRKSSKKKRSRRRRRSRRDEVEDDDYSVSVEGYIPGSKSDAVTHALDEVFDMFSPLVDDLPYEDDDSMSGRSEETDPLEQPNPETSIFGSFFSSSKKKGDLLKDIEDMFFARLGCASAQEPQRATYATESYSFTDDGMQSEQGAFKVESPVADAAMTASGGLPIQKNVPVEDQGVRLSRQSHSFQSSAEQTYKMAESFFDPATTPAFSENLRRTQEGIEEALGTMNLSSDIAIPNVPTSLNETSEIASRVFSSVRETVASAEVSISHTVQTAEHTIRSVLSTDTQSVRMDQAPFDEKPVYAPSPEIEPSGSFFTIPEKESPEENIEKGEMTPFEAFQNALSNFAKIDSIHSSKVTEEVRKALGGINLSLKERNQIVEKVQEAITCNASLKQTDFVDPKADDKAKQDDQNLEEPIELSLDHLPEYAPCEEDPIQSHQQPELLDNLPVVEEVPGEDGCCTIKEDTDSALRPELQSGADRDEHSPQDLIEQDSPEEVNNELEKELLESGEIQGGSLAIPSRKWEARSEIEDVIIPESDEVGEDEDHEEVEEVDSSQPEAQVTRSLDIPATPMTPECQDKGTTDEIETSSPPATRIASSIDAVATQKKGKFRRLSKLVSPIFKRSKAKKQTFSPVGKEFFPSDTSYDAIPGLDTSVDSDVKTNFSSSELGSPERDSPAASPMDPSSSTKAKREAWRSKVAEETTNQKKTGTELEEFDNIVKSHARDDDWYVALQGVLRPEAAAPAIPAPAVLGAEFGDLRNDTRIESSTTAETSESRTSSNLYSAASGTWENATRSDWFSTPKDWDHEKDRQPIELATQASF